MIVPYLLWTAGLTLLFIVVLAAAPAVASVATPVYATAVVCGVGAQWASHGLPHIRHRSLRR